MVGIGSDSNCDVFDMNNERLSVGDIITPASINNIEHLIVGGNHSYIFTTVIRINESGYKKQKADRLTTWDVSRTYIKKQKDKPLVIWPYKN